MKNILKLLFVLFAFQSFGQTKIGDGVLKTSTNGAEKIPVSGTGHPVINGNLLHTYHGLRFDSTYLRKPAAFTGKSLNFLRVNVGETALEYQTPSQVKTDIGLGNVDNTSDVNKPVSTAQATSIATKQATLVSGTNIKTVNSTSLLGSGNIVIAGGGGGGYKVQSAQPTDTTAVWVDKGNAYAGMYPVRRYVSGAWQVITAGIQYYDPYANEFSAGRPFCLIAWGQSNLKTPYKGYPDNSTGDVSVNKNITLYNPDAGTWTVPDFASMPSGGTSDYWSWNGNLGVNIVQEFAREFVKRTGRTVRIVQWCVGGTPLAYWEPGSPGYVNLTAAAAATGVPFFDDILGAHGEGGLSGVAAIDGLTYTSAYSTYQESLYKGIMAGLRAKSYCSDQTYFMMPSHVTGQSLWPMGSTLNPAEWAIRTLNDGNQYNAHILTTPNRAFQTPTNGNNTVSTTSINVATATFPLSITVGAGKSYSAINPILIISRATPTAFIIGQVTAYNSGTGAMTVDALTASSFYLNGGGFFGTGTLTDWDVLPQDYTHRCVTDNVILGKAVCAALFNRINDLQRPTENGTYVDSNNKLALRIDQIPLSDSYKQFFGRFTSIATPFYSRNWITSIGGNGATLSEFVQNDQYSNGASIIIAGKDNSAGTVTTSDAIVQFAGWGSYFSKNLYFSRAGNTADNLNTYMKLVNTAGLDFHLGATGTRQYKFYDGTSTALAEINPQTGIFTNYLNKFAVVYNPALTFSYTLVGGAIAANRNITYPVLVADDVPVFQAHTQTLTNKTLTAPQLTAPLLETSSTSGYVWTATNTAGAGSWQAAVSGFANPMTTTGDLIISSSGSTAGRLGIGSNNTYLKSNGTTASWQVVAADALSTLTAASATNNIDNATFNQVWNWDSFAGSGLTLSSTSTAAAGNAQQLFVAQISGANTNSSQTTYAGRFSNTHTGTGAVNVAATFNASGGTSNYAALFQAGLVGIGANPSVILDVNHNTNAAGAIAIRNPNTGTSSNAALNLDNNGTIAIIARYPSNYNNATFASTLTLREDTGDILFYTNGETARFKQSGIFNLVGKEYIGSASTAPTALLHIKAGTTSASSAPIKLTSGTNMTTPEAGAVEFDGTNYFATSSTTRYTLAKTLTNTATLDFGSTAAGAATDLTITVTGAADGDPVSLGVPNASTVSDGSFTAWVSATNTVTVRFTNNNLVSALDPASGTFRASVIHY